MNDTVEAWSRVVTDRVGLPIDVSGVRGQWSREAARGVRSAEARLDPKE